MFDELAILVITSFVWIINGGKKPFNEIGKSVQENTSKFVFKILQILVILFIILLVAGILIAIYVWIKKYLFSN